MSNNRINCCKKLDCAYLILERKTLGVSPVFGTPTIKLWGSKFQGHTGPIAKGYTGPDAITGCGAELQNKLYANIGVCGACELWSTPKLLVELPGDNIVWGGSADLKYKDYTHFVKGKFILPSIYSGITLENTEVIDNSVYYKMYAGTGITILNDIRTCFHKTRDEIPYPYYVPYILDKNGDVGGICDLSNGGSVEYFDILSGMTSDAYPDTVDPQYIFDVKVEYSSDFNAYLTESKTNVFYSVSDVQDVQSGYFEAYCNTATDNIVGAKRDLYCGGGIIQDNEDNCYKAEPRQVDSKKMAYGYFQSTPKSLNVYRVDLHRCIYPDGKPYIAVGDINYVTSITVKTVVPNKSTKNNCPKDYCKDIADTLQQNGKINMGLYPSSDGFEGRNCFSYYNATSSCTSLNNVGRSLSWSKESSCKPIYLTDCPPNQQQREYCENVDCSGRSQKIHVAWKLYNYIQTWNHCCTAEGNPDPTKCRCKGTSIGENQPYYGTSIRIIDPNTWVPDADCGVRRKTTRPNDCGGVDEFEEWYSCDQFVITPPDPCRCNAGEDYNLPEYVNYPLPIQAKDESEVTPVCPGDPPSKTTNSYTPTILILNPEKNCRGFYDLPPALRPAFAFCCCPSSKPGGNDTSSDKFIITFNGTEDTQYTINPYLMIDGNPLYFEGTDNTIPNFHKYMEYYFTAWKNDRRDLDPTVDDYKLFVDNPYCELSYRLGPANYFFFNPSKGVTAGTLKGVTCSDGTTVPGTNPLYNTVPNPDAPCKEVFAVTTPGRDLNTQLPITRCYSSVKHPTFNDISKKYSNINPQPKCFENIVDYFNAEMLKTPDGVSQYYVLSGITFSDCIDTQSINFLNNVLSFD